MLVAKLTMMRCRDFLFFYSALLVLDLEVWFEYSEFVLLWDPICTLSELSFMSLTNDGWGEDILMHWESNMMASSEEPPSKSFF